LPDQLVIWFATPRIVGDLFTFDDLGTHALNGIAGSTQAWLVTGVGDVEGRHETKHRMGSSPLVGRQEELGLLNRSWEASKDGRGQVVLIQGEAGVGKSRLLEALREPLVDEGFTWVSIRCSPYHTRSTLYPVIEHLKRAMNWQPEDDAPLRLEKLEAMLLAQSVGLEEGVPLYAELLSLPLPQGRYRASLMTPQQKRDATLDAIVVWLLELAENGPVLPVCEDLHWADPSTLELLGLYIEQSPRVSMLNVLTYPPEFVPPWSMRSHMRAITLNRLERPEVEALVRHLARGKALPSEVLEHIVTKADGVTLYVEELTKTIIESGVLREETDRYLLDGTLAEPQIPSTLQDSVMARLDRAPTLREVAQMAAVLGPEFAYDMLKSVVTVEESVLHSGLEQLVEDERLDQRARGQRSRYTFKHALIQDAAYESLLRSTRRQIYQRIAEALESHFPILVKEQPELLGHHCGAAGMAEKALTAWEKAAQRAVERLRKRGGDCVPEQRADADPRPTRHVGQSAPGACFADGDRRPLITIKGYGAQETGRAFARAQQLSSNVGATSELFTVLYGQWFSGNVRFG
jgi:predicted ATPase